MEFKIKTSKDRRTGKIKISGVLWRRKIRERKYRHAV